MAPPHGGAAGTGSPPGTCLPPCLWKIYGCLRPPWYLNTTNDAGAFARSRLKRQRWRQQSLEKCWSGKLHLKMGAFVALVSDERMKMYFSNINAAALLVFGSTVLYLLYRRQRLPGNERLIHFWLVGPGKVSVKTPDLFLSSITKSKKHAHHFCNKLDLIQSSCLIVGGQFEFDTLVFSSHVAPPSSNNLVLFYLVNMHKSNNRRKNKTFLVSCCFGFVLRFFFFSFFSNLDWFQFVLFGLLFDAVKVIWCREINP